MGRWETLWGYTQLIKKGDGPGDPGVWPEIHAIKMILVHCELADRQKIWVEEQVNNVWAPDWNKHLVIKIMIEHCTIQDPMRNKLIEYYEKQFQGSINTCTNYHSYTSTEYR
jgi:hypothetical protein